MHVSMRRLICLEPCPSPPVGCGSASAWTALEESLGICLPGDYKEYVSIYGAGRWADFFGIMSPFYVWQHREGTPFTDWLKTRLEGLDEMHQKFPRYAPPFLRYPAAGGLIPIGYVDTGGTICWQTTSEGPDSWRVVCLAPKYADGWDSFDGSLTEFLVALLESNFRPRTFPTDLFPIQRPAFTPYTSQ